MRTALRYLSSACLGSAAVVLFPSDAAAYGGPGSIISGLGALLALAAAVVAALFGFVWYPLKRVVRFFRDKKTQREEPGSTEQRGLN